MHVRSPLCRRRGLTLIELCLVLLIFVIAGALAWPAMRKAAVRSRVRDAAQQVRDAWNNARLDAIESGVPYVFRFQPASGVFEIGPDPSLYSNLSDSGTTMGVLGDGPSEQGVLADALAESGGAPTGAGGVLDLPPTNPADALGLGDRPAEDALAAESGSGGQSGGVLDGAAGGFGSAAGTGGVFDEAQAFAQQGALVRFPQRVTLQLPHEVAFYRGAAADVSSRDEGDGGGVLDELPAAPDELDMSSTSAPATASWAPPIVFFPNGRTSSATVRLISQGDPRYFVDVTLRGLTGGVRVSKVQQPVQQDESLVDPSVADVPSPETIADDLGDPQSLEAGFDSGGGDPWASQTFDDESGWGDPNADPWADDRLAGDPFGDQFGAGPGFEDELDPEAGLPLGDEAAWGAEDRGDRGDPLGDDPWAELPRTGGARRADRSRGAAGASDGLDPLLSGQQTDPFLSGESDETRGGRASSAGQRQRNARQSQPAARARSGQRARGVLDAQEGASR